MNVNVSIGEAVDKFSILELKMTKITDAFKQTEIQNELNSLRECESYCKNYAFYYKLLMYINEKIWNFTDAIKGMTIDNPEFAKISNDIFEYNQKRFRVKHWFNLSTSSCIKEQKSYAATHCRIVITTEEDIYNKIPEINYLFVEYDTVSFECDDLCMSIVQKIFKHPTIVYNLGDYTPNKFIHLAGASSHEFFTNDREMFEFIPITYIAGGLLGDFIHSLSVVCEKFYETGRKGIVYLSTKGDNFRLGLEYTYNDTYTTISSQRYMKEYKIHTNELYDYDLTAWRQLPDNLYNKTWQSVYNNMYNISWGKHPWIRVIPYDGNPSTSLTSSQEFFAKWHNKVLINTTDYRFPLLNFQLLYAKYGDDMIFVSFDESAYHVFRNKTKLQIPYIQVTDFTELCCAIASCRLFVGSLSSPLTIAHAVNTPRIVGLYGGLDDHLNSKFNEIWNNVLYRV